MHALYRPSSGPPLRDLSCATPTTLLPSPSYPHHLSGRFLSSSCVAARQFFPQCAFNAYSLHPWDYRGDREQAQYVPGDFLVHFAGKKGMKKVHLMQHYLAVVERTYGGKEGGIVIEAA